MSRALHYPKTYDEMSIIFWTRYDGTPETLPKEGRMVFYIQDGEIRTGIAYTKLTSWSENNPDGFYIESWGNDDAPIGTLWAYSLSEAD